MTHIIIQVESIMKYPPTISLIRILKDRGDNVILLTSEIDNKVRIFCSTNSVKVIDLKYSYSAKDSAITKLLKIPKINKSIKKTLDKYYKGQTLIWVMTSITLKYIGNCLDKKNYIMYMYELIQELRYYRQIPFFKVNLEKLFNNAYAVIECEYNRAHIAKAWFGLKKTPFVVPNKPYMKKLNKETSIEDEYSRTIIESIGNKKIILYQGIVDEERPMLPFIKAVRELGEEYALVIMSSDIEKIDTLNTPNVYLLPFVSPPHHLEITSWAHIGILSYYPVRNATTSPLNAIYCAPNKIYEYAMFNVPMLGNDIPGLKDSIQDLNLGMCCDLESVENIKECILQIENNYSIYSANVERFYSNTNTKKIIDMILE